MTGQPTAGAPPGRQLSEQLSGSAAAGAQLAAAAVAVVGGGRPQPWLMERQLVDHCSHASPGDAAAVPAWAADAVVGALAVEQLEQQLAAQLGGRRLTRQQPGCSRWMCPHSHWQSCRWNWRCRWQGWGWSRPADGRTALNRPCVGEEAAVAPLDLAVPLWTRKKYIVQSLFISTILHARFLFVQFSKCSNY